MAKARAAADGGGGEVVSGLAIWYSLVSLAKSASNAIVSDDVLTFALFGGTVNSNVLC